MNYTETILDNRYLQGSLVLFFSVNGLLLNFVILYSKLVTNKRAVVPLIAASYVFLLPNFFVYLPCAFASCDFYSEQWLHILSTPDTIGYYCYQLSLMHLSIERMLVFYSEEVARTMQRFLVHITVTIWLFITTLTVVEWFFGCRKMFNTQGLYIYFDASGDGKIFLDVHVFISYAAPVIMMFCYSAVFIRLRILHSNMNSSKVWKELALVFQYLFVCVLSWLGTLCFFFLSQLQSLFQSNLGIVAILASNLSLTSHAYVFLVTNEALRRRFLRCIRRFFGQKSRNSIAETTTVFLVVGRKKSSCPVPIQT